ncbi:type IV pilus secretin PilQ [Halorhodospira halochloris]|nr:type IV pilus secretin PilQ [Halorhodospira halochloris]
MTHSMGAETLQLSAIPLHNAEAEAVAKLLRSSGAISQNGSASTDVRTNTIVLRDSPANIQSAQELIAQLDKHEKQIMVEARIVLASGDYTLDLGSRLGLERRSSSSHLLGSTNSLLSGSTENGLDALLIDLPQIDSGGQFGFAVGKIGSSLLQFELSAMEAEGHGRVVSSPRVLTTQRRQARIEQGVQIPYQQSAESGATTVAFRDAALSLTVTPVISNDNSVSLQLEVTKDAVGQVFAGVPSIDTQAVTTHMRVEDGETVILGGVREYEQHEEERWVPWLGQIPILGRLFRQSRERNRYQELLIFVTPRVMHSAADLSTTEGTAASF